MPQVLYTATDGGQRLHTIHTGLSRNIQRKAKVMQFASFLIIPTCMLSAMHSRSSLNLQPAVLQAPIPAICCTCLIWVEPFRKVSQPGWRESPMVMARAWQLLLAL